jgi:tetratricopeptide (TPR) repeat protein
MKSNKSPLNTRQIRVFISSTFRDMMEERDYLVKFIFPRLRRLCESRGVTWGEVDLRWGVTDEAAAEGKVLPICLEEINRCRPYFIGLLGERYGWVPENIPNELLEKEPWLKEQFKGKKSVTELEILHGVLRNPKMADHAFFYFRDPAYIQSLPKKARKDFVSESPEEKEKLRKLKEQIRKSGLTVYENYPDPRALGRLVLADLTKVIDQHWPEGSQPDPLTREALDHAAFARSRERVYIGRKAYFDKLDAHVKEKGSQPLVILGESGSGKSALLANWTARYRESHPKDLVIEHYIGATPASADWAAMLRRIMGEFKEKLGLKQDIPEKPDALRSAFPNWLHMASAKGKVVLVLDAINQLEDRDGAPDLVWLPPVMPENVRLIVSTLPGRALDEITKRKWPVFKVEPLTVDERKELIRQFLKHYSRTLSPKRVDRIANAPQSANPLYLRVLLDELRLFGEHERLEERISYYLEADSPDDLYEKVIGRWEKDYSGGTNLVKDTLTLLWAARRGLTESELLDILGKNGQPLPRAIWSPLFLAMSDSLVSRQGFLTFTHDFLRTAVRDTYLTSEKEQKQVHIRLADYFEHQPASPRRMDELPWQLTEAQTWLRLYRLLCNPNVFEMITDNNRGDLSTFWSKIERNTAYRMVSAYHKFIENPQTLGTLKKSLQLHILLRKSGHVLESIKLYEKIDELGLFLEDTDSILFLAHHAWVLHLVGRSCDAVLILKKHERHIIANGDKYQIAIILGTRASIIRKLGKFKEALDLHKQEEILYRELGYREGVGISLGNQALILKVRGDLHGAMALHREEEQICRELGDSEGLSISLGGQASILYMRGDLDSAMKLYKEQERICRELNNPNGMQESIGNQALILHTCGDLDSAMLLFKEQERICRELGNPNGLQASLGHQGVILMKSGELDRAMALEKEAEQICRELGDLDGLQACLGNQANILFAGEDLDIAMKLYKEQEQICRELGNVEGIAISFSNQALVLYKMGCIKKAISLAEEAYQLATRHDYKTLSSRIEATLNSMRK